MSTGMWNTRHYKRIQSYTLQGRNTYKLRKYKTAQRSKPSVNTKVLHSPKKGRNLPSTTGGTIFPRRSQNAVNKMLIFVIS